MDLKDIKELIRFFDKSGVSELEFEHDDTRIYLSKVVSAAQMPQMYAQPVMQPQAAVTAAPAQADTPPASAESPDKTIDSPMVGTYYEAPTPGAASFIKTGEIVEKGQTLCIIEAMKIMNTIEADYRCKILKVLVENGAPVEYGQPIFVVEPL